MSDQHQDLTGGEALDQAKEYAQEHPEQAKGAIDALEDKLDEVTGGRFRDVIDKGGEYLEEESSVSRPTSHRTRRRTWTTTSRPSRRRCPTPPRRSRARTAAPRPSRWRPARTSTACARTARSRARPAAR